MATTQRSAEVRVSFYRTQLSSQTTLTPNQERDLATRWRSGEKLAGPEDDRGSLPFVMTIALEYRRWGLPLEDIVQEGNIGLLKAAQSLESGSRLPPRHVRRVCDPCGDPGVRSAPAPASSGSARRRASVARSACTAAPERRTRPRWRSSPGLTMSEPPSCSRC